MNVINTLFNDNIDVAWNSLGREFLKEIIPHDVAQKKCKALFNAAFDSRSNNEDVKLWIKELEKYFPSFNEADGFQCPRHPPNIQAPAVSSIRAGIMDHFQQMCADLKKRFKAFHFFEKTLKLFEGSEEERTCPICLEDDIPLRGLSVTPCAHVFCNSCMRGHLKLQNTCPTCRQPVELKDLQNLCLEIKESRKAEEARK